MRTFGATLLSGFLACCLVITGLAGCSGSPVSNPTEAPPMPSPASTWSAIPALYNPVGSISAEMIAALGSGVQGDILLTKAGLDFSYLRPGLLRFIITEQPGEIVSVQLIDHYGATVIQTATRINASGSKLLFAPMPDPMVIDDFQIIASPQLKLDFNGTHTENELNQIFGSPQQRNVQILHQSDGLGSLRSLILQYPDIEISLTQLVNTDYPLLWSIGQLSCHHPAYTTPRGLRLGLDYPAVLRLFGTGDFNIYPDDLPEPTRLEISKQDPVNDGEYVTITVRFAQGQVASYALNFEGP